MSNSDWPSERVMLAINAFNEAVRDDALIGAQAMVDIGRFVVTENNAVPVEPAVALKELNEAIREAIEAVRMEAYKTPRFIDRAADALADAATELVRRNIVDSRSPLGDALLDYIQERSERST